MLIDGSDVQAPAEAALEPGTADPPAGATGGWRAAAQGLVRGHERLAGTIITVAMALMFASTSVLGKSLLEGDRNAYVILTLRFFGVAALLAVFVVATGRPFWPVKGERVAVAVAGTLGYGTEAAFYYGALNHGQAGIVALLFYTYPVMVMIGAVLVDRKAPPRLLLVALVCSIVGGSVVVLGGTGVEIAPIGVVFIMICAASYSAYLIGLDKKVVHTDLLTSVVWLAVGAGVANAVFAVVFGNNVIPHGAEWWRVVGMVVFTAGAFVFLLASLRLIGAVRSSIIGVIEPLGVAVMGAIFLAERLTATTVIGGALILTGAIVVTVAKGRQAAPTS